ncbi:hypothetical protein D8B26_007194 [Coccidioides posadasii str. Silveira]|uniref:uncharacterized protein n=1 Tax=Coccidioides posadasii (strain RMSCC 757 / Silveira) TaxID=443226 RepID=UPI001BEEBFFA|nr:hypothetical protein D8B26_007194 [Coccidioides posadasii str. Silveira]
MALRDPPAVADAKGKIIPYAGPSMLGTYTEEMGGQIYFHTIFINREANLCGVYGGQMLMNGDPQTFDMISLFQRTIYERASTA